MEATATATVPPNPSTHSPKVVSIQEAFLNPNLVKLEQYWERIESESESERGAQSSVELRSGYSSAGNKMTPNKKPSKKRRWSYRDSLSGRSRRKPGSRRYHRWLNDVILGRRPDELYDEGAVGEDFSQFFEDFLKRSPLSRMLRDDDLFEYWKKFIDITEEDEKSMLRQIFDEDEDDDDVDDFFEPVNLSSRERYNRIDRETKKLLQKYSGSTFISDLDSVILSFLKQSLTTTNQSQFFEFKSVFAGNEIQLNLKMKDSLHRLLVHGICKFYDLVSQSSETYDGDKLVIVTIKPFTPIPSQSLDTYLQTEFLVDDYFDTNYNENKKYKSSKSKYRGKRV